ncbi:MAG: DedA family protein [Acidimicrobiales bacterium]
MQHLIASSGYLAVFLLMVAESACIPIPSEITMTFAGVLAATGHLELVAVILLGAFGNLVGGGIAFAVGRAGGRPAVRRLGRYVWLREADVDRAERWFERRGEVAVLVGRLLPVVRTFISLPAGAAEMAPGRFAAYTFLGSLPWCAGLAVAGYELGSRWGEVAHWVSRAGYVIAAVAVVAIVAFTVGRARRRRGAGGRGSGGGTETGGLRRAGLRRTSDS